MTVIQKKNLHIQLPSFHDSIVDAYVCNVIEVCDMMSVGTDISDSDSHVKNMSKRPVKRHHNSVTNLHSWFVEHCMSSFVSGNIEIVSR